MGGGSIGVMSHGHNLIGAPLLCLIPSTLAA